MTKNSYQGNINHVQLAMWSYFTGYAIMPLLFWFDFAYYGHIFVNRSLTLCVQLAVSHNLKLGISSVVANFAASCHSSWVCVRCVHILTRNTFRQTSQHSVISSCGVPGAMSPYVHFTCRVASSALHSVCRGKSSTVSFSSRQHKFLPAASQLPDHSDKNGILSVKNCLFTVGLFGRTNGD